MHRNATVRPMKLASKRFTTKNVNAAAASQLYIAHGLLGNSMNWATAARHLADHPSLSDKLRCAEAFDMRNHGNSPHSPDHTNAALASDLEGVILRGQQELRRAFHDPAACTTHNSILIGHSMGGLAVMGTLLRRANEDRLLARNVDAATQTSADGAASPFGDWPAARRRQCTEGMRAVNEEFSFTGTQPIADVLYNQGSDTESSIASRIPKLGRVSGAVIVDVTPTMRLGEQRSGADNVKETLERMTEVNLNAIHNYDEAREELIRVGMTDRAMRDFVSTNIVLNTNDKSRPATWKCNIDALASDYGSFQPSITRWFTSATATAAAVTEKSSGTAEPSTTAGIATPKPCTLPVLFVFGGNSPYNEAEHRRYISTLFPNATQVVVDGAGHFVHYEKTKDFADAVAPFIASLTSEP